MFHYIYYVSYYLIILPLKLTAGCGSFSVMRIYTRLFQSLAMLCIPAWYVLTQNEKPGVLPGLSSTSLCSRSMRFFRGLHLLDSLRLVWVVLQLEVYEQLGEHIIVFQVKLFICQRLAFGVAVFP